MVWMARLPQHLPPLTPAVLRETVACRGPVLIPRQATPFRCRSTRFSRVPRLGCGEVSSVGPGLSVGGLRVSARPHGHQLKRKRPGRLGSAGAVQERTISHESG